MVHIDTLTLPGSNDTKRRPVPIKNHLIYFPSHYASWAGCSLLSIIRRLFASPWTLSALVTGAMEEVVVGVLPTSAAIITLRGERAVYGRRQV